MNTMLFGPLDHMLEVPWPQSGMGWGQGRDSEETELLSGGRHVYHAPTPFKKYSVSYKGGTPGLQPLADLYAGVYGKGPFYLVDFNYTDGNLLPTRWASAFMLAYVAGSWGKPEVSTSTAALAGQVVTFDNTTGEFPESGISQIVACVPDSPAYLRIWGTRTGSASVKVSLRDTAGNWTVPVAVVPSAAPASVELISPAEAGNYTAIKLELFLPSGSTLTLDHINVTGNASDNVRKPGLGVGGVQFTSDLSGNIQTKHFDRIGLSLELIEVE